MPSRIQPSMKLMTIGWNPIPYHAKKHIRYRRRGGNGMMAMTYDVQPNWMPKTVGWRQWGMPCFEWSIPRAIALVRPAPENPVSPLKNIL